MKKVTSIKIIFNRSFKFRIDISSDHFRRQLYPRVLPQCFVARNNCRGDPEVEFFGRKLSCNVRTCIAFHLQH